MLAQTYSNSVLYHAQLEIGILPHNVVEIADDAKFRKLLLSVIL